MFGGPSSRRWVGDREDRPCSRVDRVVLVSRIFFSAFVDSPEWAVVLIRALREGRTGASVPTCALIIYRRGSRADKVELESAASSRSESASRAGGGSSATAGGFLGARNFSVFSSGRPREAL